MASFKPVASIERGLEVLRVINRERQSTVASLNRATGFDKATIVRILETLNHAGYVMRDPDRPLYAPTGRCLMLSGGFDQQRWIGRTAEPHLAELRRTVGWPCELALFDQNAMVIVDTGRELGELFYVRQPGFRLPMIGSSFGMAYLAFCDDEERGRIVAALKTSKHAWAAVARNGPALDRLLTEIRAQGYAISDPRYADGIFKGKVWGLSVPVVGGDRVFASINVMMLTKALSVEAGISLCVEPLQRTASRIADTLTRGAAPFDGDAASSPATQTRRR